MLFISLFVAVFCSAQSQVRVGIGFNFGHPFYYPYGRVYVAPPPVVIAAPPTPPITDVNPPVVVAPPPPIIVQPQIIIGTPYSYYAPIIRVRPYPVYYGRHYGRRW